MKNLTIHSNTTHSNITAWLCALAFIVASGASPLLGQATETQEKTKSAEKQEEKKPAGETTEKAAPEPIKVVVAGGNIQFTASGKWKPVTPRSRMLESELQIPKVGDDENNGRLTIMGAGGDIDANINRWKGQFTQPNGSDTSDKTKVEEKKIADQTVHMVDITGTFLDSVGGPMSGKKVERTNYRMLAAIIETDANGKYFVKFYGPKATVDKNAKAFKKMIESLKMAE
jgi:hypothetical protein